MYGHKNLPDGSRERGWFPKLCVTLSTKKDN